MINSLSLPFSLERIRGGEKLGESIDGLTNNCYYIVAAHINFRVKKAHPPKWRHFCLEISNSFYHFKLLIKRGVVEVKKSIVLF